MARSPRRLTSRAGMFAITSASIPAHTPPRSALAMRPGSEESLCDPHELLRTHPDERVVGVIDDHQLRTPDPVVEHLCVVERTASSFAAATTSVGHVISARRRLLSKAIAALHADTINVRS